MNLLNYGVFSSEKVKEFGTAVLNQMCTIGTIAIIICLLVVIAIIKNRKK